MKETKKLSNPRLVGWKIERGVRGTVPISVLLRLFLGPLLSRVAGEHGLVLVVVVVLVLVEVRLGHDGGGG